MKKVADESMVGKLDEIKSHIRKSIQATLKESQEKCFCCVKDKDLAQGGSGYVLYLQMIWYFAMVFFIMTLCTSPVLYYL